MERTTDFNAYTSAEYAGADPHPDASLNWNNGQQTMYPSAAPAVPMAGQPLITSAPRCDQGQLSGVDAIAGFNDLGRK
jgi:hypothetical protein